MLKGKTVTPLFEDTRYLVKNQPGLKKIVLLYFLI